MAKYEIIVWGDRYTKGCRPKCRPFGCDSLSIIKEVILPKLKNDYPQNWIGVYDTTKSTPSRRFQGDSVLEIPPVGHGSRKRETAKMEDDDLHIANKKGTRGLRDKYGTMEKPIMTYRPGKGNRNFYDRRRKWRRRPKNENLSYNDSQQQGGHHYKAD